MCVTVFESPALNGVGESKCHMNENLNNDLTFCFMIPIAVDL